MMGAGQVCIAREPLVCLAPDADAFTCSLPAETPREAADLLEAIGSGGMLGTGMRIWHTGAVMPKIRIDYERRLQGLVAEVGERRARGQAPRAIADWVVEERRQIANGSRWRTGVDTRGIFEIRDWAEYGVGGRTMRNLERRYVVRGFSGEALSEKLIQGALHPNTGISASAIRGARYLRNGGRVLVPFGVAVTAYTVVTAPQEDLPRVIAEESGSFLGGTVGSGVAVTACLVFGIATGGWGLLACGVVGGIAGGAAGATAANRLYYSTNAWIENDVLNTGVVPASTLVASPPPSMCLPR